MRTTRASDQNCWKTSLSVFGEVPVGANSDGLRCIGVATSINEQAGDGYLWVVDGTWGPGTVPMGGVRWNHVVESAKVGRAQSKVLIHGSQRRDREIGKVPSVMPRIENETFTYCSIEPDFAGIAAEARERVIATAPRSPHLMASCTSIDLDKYLSISRSRSASPSSLVGKEPAMVAIEMWKQPELLLDNDGRFMSFAWMCRDKIDDGYYAGTIGCGYSSGYSPRWVSRTLTGVSIWEARDYCEWLLGDSRTADACVETVITSRAGCQREMVKAAVITGHTNLFNDSWQRSQLESLVSA